MSTSCNSKLCHTNNNKKMKCKTIHKNLIFFLDEDLPKREMEQIRIHLSECKKCAAFSEDLKKTLQIINKENSVETNPFFYTRLKTRLEKHPEPAQALQEKPVWIKIVQPVFFSVLLISGIYFGFKIGTPSHIKTASANYTTEEILPYLNEMQSEPLEEFLME